MKKGKCYLLTSVTVTPQIDNNPLSVMKLFEMSNSYTKKTRSIGIFYTGIALLLKSWTVLCICF